MKILIDLQGAQSIGSRNRGIGRYSLSITKAILKNKKDHQVAIALSNLFQENIPLIKDELKDYIDEKDIYVWDTPADVSFIDTNNDTRRKNAQYIRETFLASIHPDMIFITSLFEGLVDDAVTTTNIINSNIPTAVVLYDLIPLIHSQLYLDNPDVDRWYKEKISHLKKADLLLSISNSSKDEAIHYLNTPSEKVITIGTASDEQFKKIKISEQHKKEILNRHNLKKDFLMYTGGIDHRKNIEGLIRSYALLPTSIRDQHQLAIVCSINQQQTQSLNKLVKSLRLEKSEIIFTGYIEENDLIALYNLSKAFIFPSWHEGFGLPALEAMNCGAAVIASDKSSLPEVIGCSEALFDSLDDNIMANKIEQILTDKVFRKQLIAHGKKQIQKFSWDQSAKKAIQAFESFVKNKKAPLIKKENIKQKLAYFSPMPPQRSGIADYSLELLSYLSDYYDIDIIVEDLNSIDKDILEKYSLETIDYFEDNSSKYQRKLYHFGNSYFHQHMYSLLSQYPGVVVLHDFYLGHLFDSIGILTQELHYSHGYESFVDKSKDNIWHFPANKRILDEARGVIVHSNHSKKLADIWYGDSFSKEWQTIPLLRVSATSTDKEIVKKQMGFPQNSFLVCSFGLLGSTKQNQKLLDAWLSSSLSKEKNSYLIFVGENDQGEYGTKLQKNINNSPHSSQIIITSWQDTQAFKNYLNITDIGVQLRTKSRGETSAAVLDCMNYAIPTIINANGAMADIDHNCVYKLQDDFTQLSLTKALEDLYQNDTKRELLGKKAQEFIKTEHKPKKCAEHYFHAIENFYTKLIRAEDFLIESILNNDKNIDQNSIKQLASSISKNHPNKGENQLLIDVSQLVVVDSNSGIQRVVKSILNELLLNPPKDYKVEPVYSTIGANGYQYARSFTFDFLNKKNIQSTDQPIDFKKGDIFLGLDLAQHIVISNSAYYQTLQAFGVKTYFIIYDLLPIFCENDFPKEWKLKDTHINWLEVIKKSNGAICISKSVEKELQQYLQTNPSKNRFFDTNSFHLGADLENSKPTKGFPKNNKTILDKLSQSTTFLLVGTLEPRKAHSQTLEAFEELWSQSLELNLVIVGKVGWLVEEFIEKLQNHSQLNKRLFYLEGISDQYLEKVYQNSNALIAPSKAEGFGLPLIEAARYKLPIIARDIAVFKEVAGEFAYYFEDKSDPQVMTQAINSWLALYKKNTHPKSENIKWLTWEQSTHQLLNILK